MIDWADENIAQDYLEFSRTHWQLLHDYVERFEIHGGNGKLQQH